MASLRPLLDRFGIEEFGVSNTLGAAVGMLAGLQLPARGRQRAALVALSGYGGYVTGGMV